MNQDKPHRNKGMRPTIFAVEVDTLILRRIRREELKPGKLVAVCREAAKSVIRGEKLIVGIVTEKGNGRRAQNVMLQDAAPSNAKKKEINRAKKTAKKQKGVA